MQLISKYQFTSPILTTAPQKYCVLFKQILWPACI